MVYIVGMVFVSCSEKTENHLPVNQDQKKQVSPDIQVINHQNISRCIRKILYYNLSVEPENYDSLRTEYFHEILGYEDSSHQIMAERIAEINRSSSDHPGMSSSENAFWQEEKDSLLRILAPYEQVPLGYIFVHTFSTGNDNLSMIFIMDKNCEAGEAIPVNTIADPDPSEYSGRLKKIKPF